MDKATSIYYGRDSPVYQSMTQNSMVRHSIQEAIRNKQASLEQGRVLRKHNFQLGFDEQQLHATIDNQSDGGSIDQNRAKSFNQQQPVPSHTDVRKSNISIGFKRGSNDYTSISKMAQIGLSNLS